MRFVTTYHGAYDEDLPFKRRYNAVMAKGEIVIAASRYIAELVIGPARDRSDPHPADPARRRSRRVRSRRRPAERTARLGCGLDLPPDVRAGGHASRAPHRLEGPARAAGRLRPAAVPGHDRACCSGPTRAVPRYTAGLRDQAKRLGMADRVRLPGECDDMPAALLLADIVVHASTEPEAFGRVVIEAQAMARPVIAADLGGPVETVQDGVTGWRVPPGQPARACGGDRRRCWPCRRRTARGDRTAAARAAVLARCTKRAMQDATLSVYRELLLASDLQGLRHGG